MTSISSRHEEIAYENPTIERRKPTIQNEKTDLEKCCSKNVRLHFACKIPENNIKSIECLEKQYHLW